jgi:hypothetical protein
LSTTSRTVVPKGEQSRSAAGGAELLDRVVEVPEEPFVLERNPKELAELTRCDEQPHARLEPDESRDGDERRDESEPEDCGKHEDDSRQDGQRRGCLLGGAHVPARRNM